MTVLDTAWIYPDGRIEKGLGHSAQLPEDPYNYSEGEGGLVRPPYDLDELVSSLESNTLHARCVKQKASDTLGRGIVLKAREMPDGGKPSAEGRDRWGAFVEGIEDDERGDGASLKERLTAAAQDFESVGWAVLEVSRSAKGELDGLWHVPAHTVRAHKDTRRFAQKRSGKLVWFKRFGIDGDVDEARGGWSPSPIDPSVRGNELLIIRNYSPRSTYYGLPDHVPAMAALAGWRAQHEFNVRFFGNQAVPSYAVVIEGATLSPALEETIRDYFRQIKADPHRTLIIPIPGVAGDEASAPKLRFERLAVDIKDASFRMYKQDNALEICIAHGVPPYRVGWPIVGSLGGATAEEMTQIYNDAIVQARQETWEQRLDRGLLGKKGLDIRDWQLKAAELDLRNEMRDLAKSKELYLLGVTTPNDSARFHGYDERTDAGGSAFIAQPLAPTTTREAIAATPADIAPAEQVAKAWMAEVGELRQLRKRLTQLLPEAAAA